MRRSLFPFGVDTALPEVHAHIRAGRLDAAAALCASVCGYVTVESCRKHVRSEAAFLAAVDASKAIGRERSKRGLTPRQALLMAAVVGWRGDDANSWSSPVGTKDFFAWAGSHYDGPEDDLAVAFKGLMAEDLFYEVHPGVFASPAYFCRYDADFLAELPDGALREEAVELWTKWKTNHDLDSGGWSYAGLCEARGEGVCCLGTSCRSFNGEKHCERELDWNPILLGYAKRDEE